MHKKIIISLVGLIIAASLINIASFGAYSLAAYLFYLAAVSMTACVTALLLITDKKALVVPRYLPFFVYILLVLFFCVHSFITKGELSPDHLLLTGNGLLLICATILFSRGWLSTGSFFSIVMVFGLMESLICLLQYVGIISAMNSYFRVTGSWVNPNVTALFLAMTLPAIWFQIVTGRHSAKWGGYSVLILVLAAIYVLKCRSAYIGAVVASLIPFVVLSPGAERIRKLNKKERLLGIVLFTICLLPVLYVGYTFKKASADGRLLVWKISGAMLLQRPFTGYGYGQFKHTYSLHQAEYFSSGNGLPHEKRNASFVKTAYNDMVETAVEGGIIAFVLLVAFYILLIWPPAGGGMYSSTQKINGRYVTQVIAVSGILAFLVMSLFNFSLKAIPAMGLFILYASLRISYPVDADNKTNFINLLLAKNLRFTGASRLIIALIMLIAGAVSLVSLRNLGTAYRQSKPAATLLRQRDFKQAMPIFQRWHNALKHSEYFLINYGKTLQATGNDSLAIVQFNKALQITSDPDLFVLAGDSYRTLRKYEEAENLYAIALNIAPDRMRARYALMNLYVNLKDSVRALQMADELLHMQPKVETGQSRFYIHQARDVKNSSAMFNRQTGHSSSAAY